MASGPYRPVSFVDGEPLDVNKLNTIAQNLQWLYENTPRISYKAYGLVKSSGAKILAGNATVPARKSTLSYATVYFGTFFSQGCQPIVVATPVQNTTRTRFETVVKGIGRVYPDHRGCQVGVTTDEYNATYNNHAYNLPVQWIAIGW